MTEQEKKELFEIISNARSNRFSNDEIARTIEIAGYRKADEVHKETAKEIIEKLIGKRLVDYDPETNEEWATWLIEKQDLQFLIDEYGVEIDDNK